MASQISWSFKHFDAKTVDEAVKHLIDSEGKASLIAGGTDLLNVLKDRILPHPPEAVINLKTIPGLDTIRNDPHGLNIGALVRLRDLASSARIRDSYPVFWKAATSVASPQIRNMATIGGNLCQDVRCWYYRTPRLIRGAVVCKRKGGTKCYALGGDNRYHSIFGGAQGCHAVCLSDLAIALICLGAQAETSKRTVPLEDFILPGVGTALDSDEVLIGIHIPPPKTGSKGAYVKFTTRKATDFAIVSVAALLMFEKKECKEARIVLGGVAPGPWRASSSEDILKEETVDASTAEEAGKMAIAGAKPLKENAYKIPLVQALVKRAILACL